MLSIAGSDSGGGAGIQADLKAFAACGVHGMTAITAITAQNTVGVDAVHAVPPEMIIAQVRAVARDIGVDAVKIGMLGNGRDDRRRAPRRSTSWRRTPRWCSIPVMVAESGAGLLEPAARGALIERLLPRATVVTPNVPEALALLGGRPSGRRSDRRAAGATDRPARARAAALARALGPGPAVVVITGGHRRAARPTCSTTADSWSRSRASATPTAPPTARAARTRSVLAARLAWGDSPLEAARDGQAAWPSEAVRRRADRAVGAGAGPVDVLGVT